MGAFSTFFYSCFLKELFKQGYTIIASPFKFSFCHWSVAISLIEEQTVVKEKLIEIVSGLGYKTDVYKERANYFWIGHSLGCKYIMLLEILCDLEGKQAYIQNGKYQYQQILNDLESANSGDNKNIRDQASLLIASDISDTKSAIPVRLLYNFLDRIGLGVLPTRKQTMRLIDSSQFFNLTALISFDRDTIAGNESNRDSDVYFLIKQLEFICEAFPIICPIIRKELHGKHLELLSFKTSDCIIALKPFNKFVRSVEIRKIAHTTKIFLAELDRRRILLKKKMYPY